MSSDEITPETWLGMLERDSYVSIRAGDESGAFLKELEPQINKGEVIGDVVNFRAEPWHVFIRKDFYEEHKLNTKSLDGPVKKAIEALYSEELRTQLNLSQEGDKAIVLERFADGETKKSVRWNDSGECTIEHYAEGKNGIYLAFTEHIFPLNKNELQLYKKDNEPYLLDKTRQLFLPARDYFDTVGVARKHQDNAVAGLSLLPVEQGEPYSLELVEKNGHIGLPPIELVYTSNWYAQRLKKALVISKDRETLEKLSQELWAISSPKQRADIVAIVGATLFNSINRLAGFNLREVTVHLSGSTMTGKTWTAKTAIKLYFGFDLSQKTATLLNSDVLSSPFRFESAVSSTGLCVLIDEASAVSKQLIDLLKAKSGGAIGARGRQDQSVAIYDMKATVISTAQTNIYIGVGSYSDDSALGNRLYLNNHQEGDVDLSKRVDHDLFAAQVKEGGLAYLWLSDYTVDELKHIVLEVYKAANGDSVATSMLLGLGLMGRLDAKVLQEIEIDRNAGDDPLSMTRAIISNDLNNPQLNPFLERDESWFYISSAYIQKVNKDPRHSLQGKFSNLGGFKEFAAQLGIEPDQIYNKTIKKRFGGNPLTYAKLPIDNGDRDKGFYSGSSLSSTYKISNILRINDNDVPLFHLFHHISLYNTNSAIIAAQAEFSGSVEHSTFFDDKGGRTYRNTGSAVERQCGTTLESTANSPPNTANQNNETSQPNAPSTSVSPTEGQAAGFASLPAPGENDPTGSMDSPMAQAPEAPPPTPAPDPTDRLATIKQVLAAVKEAENLNIAINPDDPDPRLYGVLSGLYPDQIRDTLRELEHSGDIFEIRPGYWRLVHYAENGD